VVSKLILRLFADNRQKEKGGKLVSFMVLIFNLCLKASKGDAVKSCHPEGIERMKKWKKK
jgi:hypothetical protein